MRWLPTSHTTIRTARRHVPSGTVEWDISESGVLGPSRGPALQQIQPSSSLDCLNAAMNPKLPKDVFEMIAHRPSRDE